MVSGCAHCGAFSWCYLYGHPKASLETLTGNAPFLFPENHNKRASLPELNWNSESKPVLLLSKRAFDRRKDGSSFHETLKGFTKFS